MTKRGSSQFLLLFLRPGVRLGWRILGAAALIAVASLATAEFAPLLH
jgi:Sortase domain